MSPAAEAPEAPDTAAAPRCPRCGAPMAREQDWCLECGAAVTTRVLRPPRWRVPVAIVLGTMVVLGALVAIGVSRLSDDADEAASTTTTVRPPRGDDVTRAGGLRSPQGGSAAPGTAAVPLWPAARRAHSIVILRTPDRARAQARAGDLIADGERAGILRSNGYDFLPPGLWVVWVGPFTDRPAAEGARRRLGSSTPGAYVTFLRRRQ